MLDSLILAYAQFVIMLIELHEILGQELKCLWLPKSDWNELYQKLWIWVSYNIIGLVFTNWLISENSYSRLN